MEHNIEKEYEIWMEGYAATGESGKAQFIGKAKGRTFEEACRNFREPEDIKDWHGNIIMPKGSPLTLDEHRSYPHIWGCKLFDNEADARKSFG